MNTKEIETQVITVLTEALNINHDKITSESTLKSDLGVESIDMLDIVFRLERTFNIKIPRNELFPNHIFENQNYITNGKINSTGIDRLKNALPFSDFTKFEKDPTTSNLDLLFTVGTLTNYVATKINQPIFATAKS